MTEPTSEGIALPEEHIAEWKGFAFTARVCKLALERTLDPLPDSPLAFADAHYPWEKVSAWSRDYLLAAADFLGGQNWFGLEAFDLVSKEEYEPGYFRVRRIPDVEFITAILDAAVTTLAGGTHLWLRYAGHPIEVWLQAFKDVFDRMPRR